MVRVQTVARRCCCLLACALLAPTMLHADSPTDTRAAAMDSVRARPRFAGSMGSLVGDGTHRQQRQPRPPRVHPPVAPYTSDVHWSDRPHDGPGLHVPRSGAVELATEMYSRDRIENTWQYEVWRFVADESDTAGHFERATIVNHEVRSRTRVGGQRWSVGIAGRAAITLTADGFARERWSSSYYAESPREDHWYLLNGLELRMRPFGSDTSAWAHAATFGISVHDAGGGAPLGIASAGASVRFPVVLGLRGRMAAAIASLGYVGGYSNRLAFIGSDPWFGRHYEADPVDVTLALERRVRRAVWMIGSYTWRGDRSSAARVEEASMSAAFALGRRAMLDAGVRITTTPHAPAPVPFGGLSLR